MSQIYIDAPNPASGPIPDDVAPHFGPPHFEWWSFKTDDDGKLLYDGFEAAVDAVKQALRQHVSGCT